jgi:acyl-lipid omega-6 desaturase (Delta-12 desaturase)
MVTSSLETQAAPIAITTMMLEGKQLIVATKAFAEEDRTKSWLHTLSTAMLLVAAFAGAVSPLWLALRIPCSLLTGLLLLRMFTIYHDYLHHTILKDSVVARIIFTFFGLYTLNPPSIWKRSHDHHHKHNSNLHTSSIGSFPILTKDKFLALPKREQSLYLFVRHPLTILAGYLFAFLWGMCVLSLTRNPSKHWDSAVALVMHLAIGVTLVLTLGWSAFLLGFLLPAIFSSAMGSYLFYAQHNFPTATFTDQQSWTYIGAALQSSSYMKMGALMHWFTGNIGYHHVHHTNARIPFYRLPEAYAAFPAFQNAKTTSLSPWDIAACLQMKAWDPEVNKMITLKELRG